MAGARFVEGSGEERCLIVLLEGEGEVVDELLRTDTA